MPHTFLSDAWLDEVSKLAAEAGAGGDARRRHR